jgi:hypothetical protein
MVLMKPIVVHLLYVVMVHVMQTNQLVTQDVMQTVVAMLANLIVPLVDLMVTVSMIAGHVMVQVIAPMVLMKPAVALAVLLMNLIVVPVVVLMVNV